MLSNFMALRERFQNLLVLPRGLVIPLKRMVSRVKRWTLLCFCSLGLASYACSPERDYETPDGAAGASAGEGPESKGGSSTGTAGRGGTGADSSGGTGAMSGSAGNMTVPESGALGAACAEDGECDSGACRDGVCCESECDGPCQACAQSMTGAADGTCTNVSAGEDPHEDCDEESAESCGNDGTCDGAGACRKHGSNQVCTAAACDGANYLPAATCDGAGACDAQSPVACGQHPCSVQGCETPCSKDGDCPSGAYCATDVCRNKETDGTACTKASECRSGSCVDGVCCESACSLSCQGCSQATTGQANGICAARTSSSTKPCTSGASTTCVDLTSDAKNCGTCNTVCSGSSVPGTSPVCSASKCSVACPAGTLGDGTNVCIPVNTLAVGGLFSCGLLTDGHVKCWGDPSLSLSPSALNNVLFKSITAGPDFMCGIRDNGLAHCWGSGSWQGTPGDTFYALAAGDKHVCGIRANRTLKCWSKDNSDGTESPPSGTYKAVVSGSEFSCAIVQGGGNNGRGACWGKQVGAGVFPFPAVSNNETYTQMQGGGLALWTLLPNGTARSWAKTLFSAPTGSTFKAIASGSSQNRCGLLSDSTLQCWGFPEDPVTFAPSGTFKAVSVGGYSACGVRTNGTVSCWGANDLGQAPGTVAGTFQGYW